MKPLSPIVADDVHLLNGAGACMEMFAMAFFDPGDVILMPEPYYGAFDHEFTRYAEVKIRTFSLKPSEDASMR